MIEQDQNFARGQVCAKTFSYIQVPGGLRHTNLMLYEYSDGFSVAFTAEFLSLLACNVLSN